MTVGKIDDKMAKVTTDLRVTLRILSDPAITDEVREEAQRRLAAQKKEYVEWATRKAHRELEILEEMYHNS